MSKHHNPRSSMMPAPRNPEPAFPPRIGNHEMTVTEEFVPSAAPSRSWSRPCARTPSTARPKAGRCAS